jgi:DNA primase
MIPPKTVQDILEAVRIEEVVEDFVTLRRRGVNLIGLCPFHGEKTPSFNVSPTRNIFKCFGCGKGGDAVTFLMEHERFTYPEALRWLARKYHIEIEEIQRTPEQIAEQQHTDSLYIVNDFASKHFQEQLLDTDEGKSVALAYFRKRGLREETIRNFGLGYAPDARDLLLRRAKAEGYSVDLIKQLGLCSQDGTRDFFRARVMFAIHNLSGKVAAFAGRTMSSDKTAPKYINSPETAIYVKNKILYGAFQAKKAIRQFDECILVEGYMDVISLHQAGIENVVASSGTSLTEGQLQLIKRNTANLKILYDGDPAGIKAALRGLDLALEQDLNVKIVLLPEGEDPDSYVQQLGPEAFRAYITREAKDFILFKTNLLLADAQGDPIKKAALIKDIVGSIALIPDPIKRSVYLKECSALLEVSEQALVEECNKLITRQLRKSADKAAAARPNPNTPAPESGFPEAAPYPFYEETEAGEVLLPARPERGPARGDDIQERDVIRLLIQFGNEPLGETTMAAFMLSEIADTLGSFDHPLYGKVAQECFQMLQDGIMIHQSFFLNHPDLSVRELAVDLLTEPWSYSPNWEEKYNYPLQNQPMPDKNFTRDMEYAVDMFKLRKLKKMCEQINPERIKSAFDAEDHEQAHRFMRVQMKMKEALNEIARRRNIVVLP